jgi:hypothetical protein
VLARALKLSREQSIAVVYQYDFAMLCAVARTILTQKWPPSHEEPIRKLFSDCYQLNDERKRIVHGLWFVGDGTQGLRHISRTLSETVHFEDLDKLKELTEQAARLMYELLRNYAPHYKIASVP